MDIRETVYKYPLLVKSIRFVYHDLFEGFFNGYYRYMLRYLIRVKPKEKDSLSRLGFTTIKPFKSKTWRRGNGLDHAYRRYYLAVYKNVPAFIKIAEHDKTIQNEIDVAERIKDLNWSFVPNTLMTDASFMGKSYLLAVSYVKGLHPISETVGPEQIRTLCKEFESIHKSLAAVRLVHADIHRGNLMLNANNHLVLFDFGISRFIDEANGVDYIARPGTFFQKTNNGRIYDDAFSFLQMVKQLQSYPQVDESDEITVIREREGLAQFEVTTDNRQ